MTQRRPGVPPFVVLSSVEPGTWDECAALHVTPEQSAFVAPVARYLAMCADDESPWSPYAIRPLPTENGSDDAAPVVGFVMTAVDEDGSFWIGGLVINLAEQRKGYGRATVRNLIDQGRSAGHRIVRLSIAPENDAARTLYFDLGFIETTERDGDEIVAELSVS